MRKIKSIAVGMAAAAVLLLAGCGTGNSTPTGQTTQPGSSVTFDSSDTESHLTEQSDSDMGHGDMEHDQSGDLPEGIQAAEDPLYPLNSQAIIRANHMPGMDGAEATIVGAFDTIAYSVTFTPTDGGEPIEDHKWVIQEEIEGAGEEAFQVGDEVVLNAKHIGGMEGASAVIEDAMKTTVYMVDFETTDSGEMIRNHQWLTEDELEPAEGEEESNS